MGASQFLLPRCLSHRRYRSTPLKRWLRLTAEAGAAGPTAVLLQSFDVCLEALDPQLLPLQVGLHFLVLPGEIVGPELLLVRAPPFVLNHQL